MKKLLLTACAVVCAASAFAQGTVVLNNRFSQITHVYYNPAIQQQFGGNGTADTPSGAFNWTGYSLLTGSGYTAQLITVNGANQPESSLAADGSTTTFRTGGAAGNVAGITVTLNSIPKDSPAATFELVAWDNKGGTITTYSAALQAWNAGLTALGHSPIFTVNTIGGDFNTPANLVGLQSFNIYTVPEPSTMALAGLGAAALLIFRRRK